MGIQRDKTRSQRTRRRVTVLTQGGKRVAYRVGRGNPAILPLPINKNIKETEMIPNNRFEIIDLPEDMGSPSKKIIADLLCALDHMGNDKAIKTSLKELNYTKVESLRCVVSYYSAKKPYRIKMRVTDKENGLIMIWKSGKIVNGKYLS